MRSPTTATRTPSNAPRRTPDALAAGRSAGSARRLIARHCTAGELHPIIRIDVTDLDEELLIRA